MRKGEEFLSERNRAEDILLGGLGYAEDASIVSIQRGAEGFKGIGKFSDGVEFEFSCDDELDELQQWALVVFLK